MEVKDHPVIIKHPLLKQWVTSANTAIQLGLATSTVDNNMSIQVFSPNYTYQLFGDHESIFGYKDLKIKIICSSGSLCPYLEITYSDKYTDTAMDDESIEADDIMNILQEYLPSHIMTHYDVFANTVQKELYGFKPRGEKIHEYSIQDKEGVEGCYEIYKCSFSDDRFREYHQRMQFLTLMFIEGSSYIDDTDNKWEIYTTYMKSGKNETTSYHLIGYCTAYPFYCWPENVRMRISQFLILPPYQKMKHGSILYQSIYELFKARKEVIEMTVEDPSEEFSDMRDKNDYRYLHEHHAFDGLKAPVPAPVFKALYHEYKLTRRQISRCLELYLLSRLNKMKAEDYKEYRLEVKRRLYEFNYDVLKELNEEDRVSKLDETYHSVEEDYHRLLEMI